MVGPWTSDEGISHELNWAAEELETIRRLVPRAQGVAAYRTALSALTAESNEQLFRLVEESSLAFERGDHAPLDLAETRRITAATRQRQLGKTRPRLLPSDRAFVAALLHRLPRDVLGRFRLLVQPETVLRWHRDRLVRRHAARSRPRRPGRPRTVRSIRLLVRRLARENPSYVEPGIMWSRAMSPSGRGVGVPGCQQGRGSDFT